VSEVTVMKVHVARWGNSTAMRFPKSVVDALRLEPGTQLNLAIEGRDIRLTHLRPTSRGLLDDMVKEAQRLGPAFEPETVDWGPDRGSEVIDDNDPR
jgi:antitoxin MazE